MGSIPSLGQREIVSHVANSVRQLGRPPSDLNEGEALRSLRLCLPYDESSGGPVSYDPSCVSFPEPGTVQQELGVLWGDGGDYSP